MSLISQYIVNDPQFLCKYLKAQDVFCYGLYAVGIGFKYISTLKWIQIIVQCKTIQQHYTNCICASQATIATSIDISQHRCKRLHVLIDRLLSADGYSDSNKQSMHNFQWSDSIASARARVILRSLLHSGYHDMELRRILKTHLKLLTGKCNEDFFQDNSSDITGILSLLCTYPTTSYCSNHWTTCSLHPWWDWGCQMTGP